MPTPARCLRFLPVVILAAGPLVPPAAVFAGQAAPPAVPAPLCAIATTPDYGRTPENPARVGGSPLYGGARQRRYLESLRGPGGEPVKFTRLPAVDSPDGETLIDRYEVTYEGLANPEILHLDWYHYTEVLAPRGFVCGQAFNLGLPPPDPFMAADQLQRLALTEGGAADFTPTPIDLGGGAAGVAFDHFRLLARAAHAARQTGTPLVAGEVPQAAARPHSVVVAFPQTCEGGTRPADAIALDDQRGRTTTAESLGTRADDISRLVPGLQAPAGSVAGVFGLDGPRAGLTVKVTYREACSGTTEERTLELTSSPAKLLESPMPTRPAGDPDIGTWIAVQAIVDHAGRFREATALGGPPELAQAAVDVLSIWRAEPPRVNGAPLASPVVLQLTFRAATP
jgi:hypothetical protein